MAHVIETSRNGENTEIRETSKPVILEFRIGANRQVLSNIHIGRPVEQTGVRAKASIASAEFSALWDTGATTTMVAPRVVQAANLDECGYMSVTGVHGETRDLKAYRAAIVLSEKPLLTPDENTIAFHEAKVAMFERDDQIRGVDVIIGMDLMLCGDFWVSGTNGERWFSFCYPATGTRISITAERNESPVPTTAQHRAIPTAPPRNFRPNRNRSKNSRKAGRRRKS